MCVRVCARVCVCVCARARSPAPSRFQVGEAIARALSSGLVPSRADLWLQTKYTAMEGHDPKRPLPYDPRAPLEDQVRQSVATSLRSLHTHYLDSLVLHSPLRTHADNMRVWRVFEELVAAGTVRAAGVR